MDSIFQSCCSELNTLLQASWPPLGGDFIFLLDPVSGHLRVQGTKTQHFIQYKFTAGSSSIKLQKFLDQLAAWTAAETNLWGLGASKTVSFCLSQLPHALAFLYTLCKLLPHRRK